MHEKILAACIDLFRSLQLNAVHSMEAHLTNLPYVTAHGNIQRALDGIKKAAVPEKVSGDFVKTILGIKGGSGDQITSFLKKIGFVEASGVPTTIYKKFRNPSTSGQAVADAMREAYKPLFERNEHVYALNDEELKGLIVEETGQAHDSNPVKMIFNSFKSLNNNAEFAPPDVGVVQQDAEENSHSAASISIPAHQTQYAAPKLNVGYNIHLNLPATNDISVFNAIFKSLRENLLANDD